MTLGRVAHLGFVVDDLDATMTRLGVEWWVSWAPVRAVRALVRVADSREPEPQGHDVRFVTSRQGDPYVKVIEAVPGSVWPPDGGDRLDHWTFWVTSLRDAVSDLERKGYALEATGLEEDGRPRYAYLRSPQGWRIELGCESNRGEFETWARESHFQSDATDPLAMNS